MAEPVPARLPTFRYPFSQLPSSFLNIIALILFVVYLFQPTTALAYIGPGAGFAIATSLFMAVATLLVALLGLLLWPIRSIYKKIKTRKLKKILPYYLRKKKVLVIGFDGMDYALLSRFMKEGKLPTFTRLANTGTFSQLISTTPPESPVAWASFMTGCNPGKHNIFDFLARDPESYLPKLSIAEVYPPRWRVPLGKYRVPLLPGPVLGKRKDIPFWKMLGDRDIKATIIRVPVTFPAEKFNGIVLSSMGVPDLLGSQGTFTFYTTDALGHSEKEGGVIVKVEKNENKIKTYLRGPKNSLLKTQPQVMAPILIEVNQPDGTAVVHFPQQVEAVKLRVQEYSSWVEVAFSLGLGVKVYGICKFYLKRVAPEFELYVTPINIHPEKPSLPISYPHFYSKYLSLATGRFATSGLAEDTWALNNGCINEDAFLEQCYGYLEERERIFFHELDKFNRGCLVQVFDTTDRIQHMFWQFIDHDHPNYNPKEAEKYQQVIFKVYDRMDKITKEVLARVDRDTIIYILSDHGFKSFHYGMNINTWLKEEGYLVLKDNAAEGGKFFQGVDWTKTKAYAIGLSGIYLNLNGRERHGSVAPGNEADALIREISMKLIEFKHPGTNVCPLHRVNNKNELYKGQYLDEAPDIVLGFRQGYRVSWKTTLGATPAGPIIEDNLSHWGGDHCLAPEFVPGIFFSNRKINSQPEKGVSILDLAPTVLKEFGIDPPETMDGKALI